MLICKLRLKLKIYHFIILIIISWNISAESYTQEHQPIIKYIHGEYILNLPSKMESALTKFNPSFIHWKTKDYTSKILSDIKKEDIPYRAPFALIVDVNKDGKPDVILDGHDNNKAMLICILSGQTEYNVLLIDEYPKSPPNEIANYNDGKREYGLNYYLWINEQNKDNDTAIFTKAIPQQSDAKGNLLNDGAMIDYFFRDGDFIKEKQIL